VARARVDYLLIGGGLRRRNCARWLREEGATARSCWSGREPDPPYNRPPLSKGYLQGKESREDVLFRPDEWWDEQRIELLTATSVMKLDAERAVATLSTRRRSRSARPAGDRLERQAPAGGRLRPGRDPLSARVRQLGGDQGGRGAARAGGADRRELHRVRGGGVADRRARRGLRDRDAEDVTFEPLFGKEVGGFFQGVLEEHGIKVHGGEELERFEGDGERVTEGGHEERPRDRVRLRGRWDRRDPRRDAGEGRRARDRRARAG
jgi:3-phenylpropionate/trans-cinnamate dioxygenase ferredoxin reductase subunit